MPFKNIGGTLCARVILRTEGASVPAHIVLDLGTRGPMLVHYGTAALLGFQKDGLVDVLHEETGTALVGVQSVAMALEPLETLTREHAAELGDIPAVAVIGLPAFAGSVVELDVSTGVVRWSSAEEAGGGQSNRNPQSVTVGYTAEAYGYWLTGSVPDGSPLRVRFTTAEYDTRIDAKAAERLGAPGGDLESLMLGGLDIMKYTVLRPSDHSGFPDPKPDVIIGTQLLSAFLVRIAPEQRTLTWIPIHEPSVAAQEREFFVARANRNLERVEAFVRNHPDSRLAGEAAETLLKLCLDHQPTDPEAVKRALTLRAEAAEPQRRAMTLVAAADELIGLDSERADAYDLAVLALEVARKYCSADLNDVALHHVNARYGLIALLRGDYTTARRWLLSAAFGIPRDPYVNFYMGWLYDQTAQLPRAWSRYLEACLKSDPPRGALRRLDRLNNDPVFRQSFRMADAEQLLEGRVPIFVPARTWNVSANNAGRPVRLVELFTSMEVPATQAAEMAFDGLAEYLGQADTVFLQYHVDDVLSSDASDSRVEFYGVQSCPAAFLDGSGPITESGEDEAALRVFEAYRKKAVPTVAEDSQRGRPVVSASASLVHDNLRASVRIDPADGDDTLVLHLMLCERAVMAIGANGQIMHHHVVRAPLTNAEGFQFTASAGAEYRTEASLWAAGQRLEQRIDELARRLEFKPAMRPTWVAPAACEIVAFVQETDTAAVRWAGRFPVENGEGQSQ